MNEQRPRPEPDASAGAAASDDAGAGAAAPDDASAGGGPDASAGGAAADGPGRSAARQGTGWPRGRRSGAAAVIALLVGLLGFALVVQVRSATPDASLSTARTEDLVAILSDLDARQARLRQEISGLQQTQRQLQAGSQSGAAALQQARQRADDLGLLAGTLAAAGPGLVVTLAPAAQPVRAATVLDAIEELRGAGAEVMQIGDQHTAVRIVNSTWFVDNGAGLLVDGVRLSGTYTITVIGDPQTLRPALSIPGGVVDTAHQRGGNVIVQEPGTVSVTALHHATAPRYAHPVS